jgi:hypothetical protein
VPLAWAVRFDPSVRFDDSSPLPEEEYRGPATAGVFAGDTIAGDARGHYKYWVGVYHDGVIFMDDPDVVVEA